LTSHGKEEKPAITAA